MAAKRSPQCPSLPPELWIRILAYNTDLTHLWTVCRHVSSHFRAYTEQVFADLVLRNTNIDFHLEKYNLGGKSKRPEVPTSFARFVHGIKLENGDREKTLVCFQDLRRRSEIAGGKKKEYNRIMERWESNIKEWKPEMPNYTIRIGNIVNDTELTDLSIDIALRQIQFNWRQALTLFFREQALLRYLRSRWEAESDTTMEANKERLAKGEHLTADDYPMPRAAAELEWRKQIRRKRLREYHADNERMVWAIGSLERFENHSASHGSSKAFKLNPDLPGTGVGEKYFGSVNLVQELYLDEWSCMHRIDTKIEHMKGEEEFPRFSVPPPDLKKE
ncbi:uncharacterized protein N0V89_005282 [Didymosphaeria variabile]|uniref:F-box domain-containing protein n=1 Tax=Didymosphaeria variabile TaxID=1932322 RepID=A0A9W8XN85_9PLEO|nr:uncharacterized protein N0V89_005282 [Didymosphaeria variabile]KAJ4353552.1 hypothetical protein N0V89_005282 [Didymosphaeria variabile]